VRQGISSEFPGAKAGEKIGYLGTRPVRWRCDEVNKTELISTVAGATGESKRVVGDVLDEFVTQIQRQVKKGDKVTLPGFGTFSRRQRAARTARNPRTGDTIKVRASKVPAFKAGAGFKDYVSGSRKR
jgi:DNA-binding protein HU-beta